jgi:WD40 repeat protein
MASFVRESKIRHMTTTLAPKEVHYEQLKVSNVANDNNMVTANDKFLAYIDSGGGGSVVAVLPLTSVGKNHIPVLAPSYQQPLVRAHSQPVQDLCFNPFDSQQLLTCSTDGNLKIWAIPHEGYIVDDTTPTAILSSSSNALRGICSHPSAAGIVACRGTKEIQLFDLVAGTCVKGLSDFSGEIQSLCWSYFGDLLATTTKDKFIQLSDVRASGIVSHAAAHGNHRTSRSMWLGASPYLLSTGFTNTHDREIAIWDSRNFSTPVKRQRVDNSTGPLIPFYDVEHNYFLLTGKGDSSVRIYEFDSSDTAPEIHPISTTSLGSAGETATTRGACLMPKQVNDVMNCEVLRMLRLTENSIQPVSFAVPRKEKLKFHADLFPPTTSGAPPATSADEWLSGANTLPNRVDITPNSATVAATAAIASLDITGGEDVPSAASPSPDIFSPSGRAGRVTSYGSTLKYRHVYGKDYPKDSTWYNLSPSLSAIDGPMIASNGFYWAIPYRGAGGAVFVSRVSVTGKVDSSPNVICGHRAPVLDVAFSPYQRNLLATASDDSHVKLWRLPEAASYSPSDTTLGLPNSLSDADALCDYSNHSNSVKCVAFHPRVETLIATASSDSTVRLWDINQCSDVCFTRLELAEGGTISNIDFNYSGYTMLAACKDKVIRLFDPRQGVVVQQTPDTALGRNLRAIWCNNSSNDAIVATFVGPTGRRQVQSWDPRQMTAPVNTHVLDSGSGTLFPFYDEDTGMCIVAGKGDTVIRIFELSFLTNGTPTEPSTPSAPNFSFAKSADYQSATMEPISGFCLLPKGLCDYRNIEINRVLKLSETTVSPLSFYVPRADNLKPYFQDDLFPPTRLYTQSATIEEWMESTAEHLTPPVYRSMKPDDMEAVSDRRLLSQPPPPSHILPSLCSCQRNQWPLLPRLSHLSSVKSSTKKKKRLRSERRPLTASRNWPSSDQSIT